MKHKLIQLIRLRNIRLIMVDWLRRMPAERYLHWIALYRKAGISVILIATFVLQGLAWGHTPPHTPLGPGQNEFIVNSSQFVAWRKAPKKDLLTMNYKLSTALLRPQAMGEGPKKSADDTSPAISELGAVARLILAVKEKHKGLFSQVEDDAKYYIPFLRYRIRNVQQVRFHGLEDYVNALLDTGDSRYPILENERNYTMQGIAASLKIILGSIVQRPLTKSRAAIREYIKALIEEKIRTGDKRIVIKDLGTGRGEPKEIDYIIWAISGLIEDSSKWEIVIQGYDIEPGNLWEIEFNMLSKESWYHKLAEKFKRVMVDLRYCDLRDENQYGYIFEDKSDITLYRRVSGSEDLPLERPELQKAILDSLSPHGFFIYNNYKNEVVVDKNQAMKRKGDSIIVEDAAILGHAPVVSRSLIESI